MTTKRTVGAVIVLVVAVLALISLVWTPYDPLQAEVAHRLGIRRTTLRKHLS